MNINHTAFLELLKIGVTEQWVFCETLLKADWTELVSIAGEHGVSCLCMHALEIMHKQNLAPCPSPAMLALYARSMQVRKAVRQNGEQCKEFAIAMRPFRLAVLKGIDYAALWPKPEWREFGDLDCYEIDGMFGEVDKKALNTGLKVEDGDYKHTHIHYKSITVENHYCFTSFAGSRQGQILEEELKKLIVQHEDEPFKHVQDSELLSPRNEFTAVFMLAHAQNHFFLEGIVLRHILDWYFFLMKKGTSVDWSVVMPVMEKAGLLTFAEFLTLFCIKHFGLQTHIIPLNTDCIGNRLLMRFEDDVFSKQMNPNDRRPLKMVVRMLHRYRRMWRFRKLNKMGYCTAIWRTIAFSSFLHRKPEL